MKRRRARKAVRRTPRRRAATTAPADDRYAAVIRFRKTGKRGR